MLNHFPLFHINKVTYIYIAKNFIQNILSYVIDIYQGSPKALRKISYTYTLATLHTMKRILFILFLLTYTLACTQAQTNDPRVMKVKQAMLHALGGEKAINGIKHFNYAIIRTAYGTDTTTTRTDYTLDLVRQHVQEKQVFASDTIIKKIDDNGAWLVKNGYKTPLPEKDVARLQRILLTNFIPMLRNKALVYEYKQRSTYKGRQVDIIKVYTPQKQSLILDLFVDVENGQILTSSRPDENGKYGYYADELEYRPIGEGVVFPLVYQIWIDEKKTAEGRFVDVVIKK